MFIGESAQRVQKANGELSWYDAGDGELMAETDISGNTTADYIFMNGAMIAQRASGTVYYFFGDRLNSARVMTDALGAVKQESDYYPFGGERVITAFVDNRYKFTGLKRDSETTLDYTEERMYSSGLARWASTDPVQGDASDPQSLNLYTYVGNNPTNFIDPSGSFRDNPPEKNDARGSGPFCGHHQNQKDKIPAGCQNIAVSTPTFRADCCARPEFVFARVSSHPFPSLKELTTFKVINVRVTATRGLTVGNPNPSRSGDLPVSQFTSNLEIITTTGGTIHWTFEIECKRKRFPLPGEQTVRCNFLTFCGNQAAALSSPAASAIKVGSVSSRPMRGSRGSD